MMNFFVARQKLMMTEEIRETIAILKNNI